MKRKLSFFAPSHFPSPMIFSKSCKIPPHRDVKIQHNKERHMIHVLPRNNESDQSTNLPVMVWVADRAHQRPHGKSFLLPRCHPVSRKIHHSSVGGGRRQRVETIVSTNQSRATPKTEADLSSTNYTEPMEEWGVGCGKNRFSQKDKQTCRSMANRPGLPAFRPMETAMVL